ncbi:MAG: flagellar biosynthesis anti-sigma factor FlgM, partial [Deltaproteobacteria bacterium]|nr:flagellar biosynthesis anti-sigma factor FlgM [Deltaproteobacteria bacterium]
ELRGQIQNGTYEINPEKTAEKLLKEHLFNDQFEK